MRWLDVKDKGIAVAPIRKSASRAMSQALCRRPEHHQTHMTETPVGEKFAFIRNPFDRLESAYDHTGLVKTISGEDRSFDDFVRWAVTSNNEHVYPQALQAEGATFLPLSDLSQWWAEWGLFPMSWIKPAKHSNSWSDELKELVYECYKTDLTIS